MTRMLGKVISGGTPLSDTELETLARDQFEQLRKAFPIRLGVERTTDKLSLRLAEELRLLQRIIGMVEDGMVGTEGRALQRAEAAIEDIAEIVEARDPCEAIQGVDPDMARRLVRSSLDGEETPCARRLASNDRG